MKIQVRAQLSAMMFLNFFVWGIWFVTMGTYLIKGNIGATDEQTGLAYGTQCLGAIIAPFIIGMIADRFFSAQRILGVLHLAGAALLWFIASQEQFPSFYTLLLVYMIIYMPTLALVNAIALKQVTDPEKQFGGIRMWGTIGWIVAGLIIGWMAWEPPSGLMKAASANDATPEIKLALKQAANKLNVTFLVAAVVSGLFGLFSFTLPDTPPPKAGRIVTVKEVIGLDALDVLKDRNYLIFFLASILICIPLAFYYGQTNLFLNESGMKGAAGEMIWGQVAETVFLFLMPFFFSRFGVKQMLLIGMFAWVARYLFFAYGNMESGTLFLYGGILLHGICYDFFFVTGQIYTDRKAGNQVRSSAQGLITLATYGVGMYIGFWLAGQIVGHYAITDAAGKIISHQWQSIWIIPCLFAAGVALLFMLFFRNDKTPVAVKG